MRRGTAVMMTALCTAGCNVPPAEPDAQETSQVAFVTNRDGNFEIYLYDLIADSSWNLTNHPGMDFGFSWSPDGAAIAFASDRDGDQEIYVVELESGAVTQLTDHEARDGAPSWSADGRQIAFVSRRDSDSGEIYVMNVDGTEVRRITRNERYEEVPSWSPDGASLVFGALGVGIAGAEPTLQIFEVDLASGEEVQLTHLGGHNSAPSWTSDGRILFYGQVGEGFEGADIFALDRSGNELRNLTNGPDPDWQPDASPDGREIVFARGPGEPLDLWIMNADGTNQRVLLEHPGRDEQPKWRPIRR